MRIDWQRILAWALRETYPPTPDITTWDVARLDELCLWAAAVDGAEIVTDPQQVELPTHGSL